MSLLTGLAIGGTVMLLGSAIVVVILLFARKRDQHKHCDHTDHPDFTHA